MKFSELLEFVESNGITENSRCLVKDSEGLWNEALITMVSETEEKCSVKLLKTQKEIAADFQNVLPLRNEAKLEEKNGEENLEEFLENDSAEKCEKTENSSTEWSWDPGAGPSNALGGWEEHTKGIGSKLMSKMGYVFGQGLGRNRQGRIEPVEARILPKGT